MKLPNYWKTTLEDIEKAYDSAKNTAQKGIITYSAGNRPVYMLAYGEKKERGSANYSSALGALDKSCYKGSTANSPCVVIIGAVHGQETEGVASIMNLISLLEHGVDLDGNKNDTLLELTKKVRLVLVPVLNPDGRARVEPPAIVGLTGSELRYWGQGTWKDGSLCGWPDCKKIHPILDAADHLGGYYNDDGINIMHDNFFNPMAKETSAILQLCDDENADFILQLHGGSNSKGDLLQPAYVTKEVNEAVYDLSNRCLAAGKKEGLEFSVLDMPEYPHGENPPSFNLVSAIHHVCGGVSVCYESNECIIDEPGPKLTHRQIIRTHMILFEETIRMSLEGRRKTV